MESGALAGFAAVKDSTLDYEGEAYLRRSRAIP
jgi:hypothetical protein